MSNVDLGVVFGAVGCERGYEDGAGELHCAGGCM